jgi:hypothetical protein
MIFAREMTGPLTSLVKKIDAATATNKSCKMGSFVVFLSQDENLEKKLKELSEKESLKNTIVTLMENPAGPPSYKVAKDAAVTVVLYNQRKVEANFAYAKGEMTDKDVDTIVHDLTKILPAKDKK